MAGLLALSMTAEAQTKDGGITEQMVHQIQQVQKPQQRALFNKQKDLLDTFLAHGAIDRRQYEKSLTCMAEKMGMQAEDKTPN